MLYKVVLTFKSVDEILKCDHSVTATVVKTTVTHSPAARVPLLCFDDILTSSMIYY